jgi:WxL domain surface cell wall-binding
MPVSKKITMAAFAVACAAAVAVPGFALATTPGTATLSPGTLTFVAPTAVTFSGTLTGVALNLPATQSLDVTDNTGSNAGWNVTLSATQFTTGTFTLPAGAASQASIAAGSCDVAVTGQCTVATGSPSVPVALSASAVRVLVAAVNTGELAQTSVSTMNLAVPVAASAGTYLSTWTYSLVSAP